MNNQYPYDGAVMPIVVSPASAPPPGRDARQGSERRGGGGGFFESRDRYGGGDDKDWSNVRRGEQPSGGDDGSDGLCDDITHSNVCPLVPNPCTHLLLTSPPFRRA